MSDRTSTVDRIHAFSFDNLSYLKRKTVFQSQPRYVAGPNFILVRGILLSLNVALCAMAVRKFGSLKWQAWAAFDER